jgi:ubiquitin-protein ligase
MSAAIRRLKKEADDLFKESVPGFKAAPMEEDLFVWNVVIEGPSESVYENCRYGLKMVFPPEYPFKAPKVTFITPIYHPNVMLTTGEICLDILKEAWAPIQSVRTIMLSIQSILKDPNPASALNHDAGRLMQEDPTAMRAKVLEMVRSSAPAPSYG